MSFAKIYSAQVSYLKGELITVEVDLSRGLHSFSIVGLPDKAIEEARDRISAAIKNSGFDSPKSKNQKVVFSLAPAELKKEGSTFDIAMALAYLLASEDIDFDPESKMFFGELALDGGVRKITGTLALVCEAKRLGFKEIYLPKENASEASLVDGIAIYPVSSLRQIVDHLNEKIVAKTLSDKQKIEPFSKTKINYRPPEQSITLEDIKGQEGAKRGLEIAAAGGHNLALSGPPGTGKTMLAKAFCGLLPALHFEEVIETTCIHSVAGTLTDQYITHPPFRSPHHTSSFVSMIGGGSIPKPGEITLSHRGILFLDEFPEFDRKVLEALREPLEDGIIHISRAKGSTQFPSRFILIAAMNPCPCGNFGTKEKACTCGQHRLENYANRISGPLMDRIDMWIEVGKIDYEKLSERSQGETTAEVRKRIIKCRKIQSLRFESLDIPGHLNSDLRAKDIPKAVILKPEVKKLLQTSAQKLVLSARSYHRIIKLARTIADLDASKEIEAGHLLEALQYRPRPRLPRTD